MSPPELIFAINLHQCNNQEISINNVLQQWYLDELRLFSSMHNQLQSIEEGLQTLGGINHAGVKLVSFRMWLRGA